MIEWKEDASIEGWTGDLGEQWVLEITPHAKGGWLWCVICDDADHAVPQGWDQTLKDAMARSEQAFFEWNDGEEEHDETADIVANAVAQERAAVVAYLREQASQWLNAEKCQRTEASMGVWIACGAIERGEHRRKEAVCAHGNTECRRCGVGPGCGEHRREETK